VPLRMRPTDLPVPLLSWEDSRNFVKKMVRCFAERLIRTLVAQGNGIETEV